MNFNSFLLIVCLFISTTIYAQNPYAQTKKFSYELKGKKYSGAIDVSYFLVNRKTKKTKAIAPEKRLNIDARKIDAPSIKVVFSNLRIDKKHQRAQLEILTKKHSFLELKANNTKQTISKGKSVNFIYGLFPSKKEYLGQFDFNFSLKYQLPSFKINIPIKENIRQAFKLSTKPLDLIGDPSTPKSDDSIIEIQAWKKALKADHRLAFVEFIQKYPKSSFRSKCDAKIKAYEANDHRAWAKAKKENTISAYKQYLSSFKHPIHEAEAAEMISQKTGETAKEVLTNIYKEKVAGLLAFHCDTLMEIGQTYIATMTITSDITQKALEEVINKNPVLKDNKDDVKTEIIKIGKQMRVSLKDIKDPDEPHFSIKSNQEGKIMSIDLESGETTNWTWSVKPLKDGKHQLVFNIEIINFNEHGNELIDEEPIQNIFVEVRIKNSFWNNYKWGIIGLGSISMLSIFGFLFYRRKNKKKLILQKAATFTDPLMKAKFLAVNDILEDAIEVIDNAIADDHELHNDIIIIKSRIVELQKVIRQGTIVQKETIEENASLKRSILQLIESLQ